MSGTPMIHDLVRDGRATPEQGALLIEFRQELIASRERKLRSRSPVTNLLLGIGAFVLVLLGVRRDSVS